MAQNQSEIRYLNPPTVEVKRKILPLQKSRYQICRLQRRRIPEEFLNEQGKILPRRLTGTSQKFQKKVATAVKRARHLALLPFVTICSNNIKPEEKSCK